MRAEPAAVFVDLLELVLRRAVDAAVAAFVDVALLGDLCWDNAEPAADFADLLALSLRSTLEAAVAACLLVTSDLVAMILS